MPARMTRSDGSNEFDPTRIYTHDSRLTIHEMSYELRHRQMKILLLTNDS